MLANMAKSQVSDIRTIGPLVVLETDIFADSMGKA